MTYQRVDYFTTEGKQSSAYYEKQSQNAWDVYTRAPVSLTEETPGKFTEWSPPPTVKEETLTAPKQGPIQVSLKPVISFWQIVPIGLFGLGCIWLELTLGK